MPQANRMNRDRSDVMNNEATLVNGTTVNSGATADNGTRIPVPHGLDDLEVQEWLESLDSLLESSGPEVATEFRSASVRTPPFPASISRSPRTRRTPTQFPIASSRFSPAIKNSS